MVQRRCRYCERVFQPSKFQPGQSVCSESECQRRRRSDAHRRKLKIFAGTANHPLHIARAQSLGVDGIVSDYPDRL